MRKSTAKTISWLVVSGVLIWATSLYETGLALASIKTAMWACLLKTPVFWVHELFWERNASVLEPVPEC